MADPEPRRSHQVARIARLLGVDAAQVQGLDDVPDADLRTLHDQVGHALFGDAQDGFAKVAGLAALIPGPLAGRLAERFVPPVIGARVAEVMEPARARDLVTRVRIDYLCEIAVLMDPVRSRPVVQALPAERVGEVARALFARREHAVMAEFVSSVTVGALRAALEVAGPRDLLAVVPMLEWNASLDEVVADLPDSQLQAIVDDLDPAELADLALALDPVRFGPVVEKLDAEVVGAIAAELFARAEHAAMARFAGVVTPAMLLAALDRATDADLLAVVPHLAWTPAVEQVVADLPAARAGVVARARAAHFTG